MLDKVDTVAQRNMIEQQLRTADILDEQLLAVIEQTPRACFVPTPYQSLAYSDARLPIDAHDVMMTPVEEAKLLTSLAIQPTDHVLEIGTGTGYLTALLAKLAQHVDTVDINPEFIHQAQTTLTSLGLQNIHYQTADCAKVPGPIKSKTYDAIAVTGAFPDLPNAYLSALNPGGRLFVIVGNPPTMAAKLITKQDNHYTQTHLFETDLPWLQHAEPADSFSL